VSDKPRRISGRVTLQCNSDATHQWEEGYSVCADESGNPDLQQLNYFLKRKRTIQCPKCGSISFKVIKVIVTAVHA